MTQFTGPRTEAVAPVANALDRIAPAVHERLVAFAGSLEFEAGSPILREGVDTPFLGLIETGRVALSLRVPERGERLTIVTIEPGELIGWSAVVAPYRATVDATATERTRLLAFDAPALRARLAQDRELAAELLPLVLESVSRRLNASWSQLLDLFGSRTPEPW